MLDGIDLKSIDQKPFVLTLLGRDGSATQAFYDQHTSRLTDSSGRPLVDVRSIPQHVPVEWREVFRTSPETPASKSNKVERLKIQLGLGCNYSCSYCLQAAHVQKATSTSLTDAERFLGNLDKWLDGSRLGKIEFWGGEPLLYWRKVELLAPALAAKFPGVKFSMITNGSLLTPEIVDRLDALNFTVVVSHDGPGQHVRGPDPLALTCVDVDEATGKASWTIGHDGIRAAVTKLMPKGLMSFNAVMTPASYDVAAIVEWFRARIPNAVVSLEGVVHQYGADPNASFTTDQLVDLTRKLTRQILDGSALACNAIGHKMRATLDSFINERPSFAIRQKCGMDREGFLAVDLAGNVMTCQNTGAKGQHKIGHVDNFDAIKLTTAWHWANRPECHTCPVLQLCQGACMYQTGPQWAASCNAEFAFNMAFFNVAIFALTGKVLERIDGDMIRPSAG
jgi:uncharacterized protein